MKLPGDLGRKESIAGIAAVLILLTIRPLYRLYLKIRAYHVKKGSEWQNWRERGKGDNDNA